MPKSPSIFSAYNTGDLYYPGKAFSGLGPAFAFHGVSAWLEDDHRVVYKAELMKEDNNDFSKIAYTAALPFWRVKAEIVQLYQGAVVDQKDVQICENISEAKAVTLLHAFEEEANRLAYFCGGENFKPSTLEQEFSVGAFSVEKEIAADIARHLPHVLMTRQIMNNDQFYDTHDNLGLKSPSAWDVAKKDMLKADLEEDVLETLDYNLRRTGKVGQFIAVPCTINADSIFKHLQRFDDNRDYDDDSESFMTCSKPGYSVRALGKAAHKEVLRTDDINKAVQVLGNLERAIIDPMLALDSRHEKMRDMYAFHYSRYQDISSERKDFFRVNQPLHLS